MKPNKPTSRKSRSGGLEHPIGPELHGVTGLEWFDSDDEAGSSAAYSFEVVAAANEEGEVVAEITVALMSFFVEEVLWGRGELVEVANWDRDLDPLVWVVESGLGIIWVGFPSEKSLLAGSTATGSGFA